MAVICLPNCAFLSETSRMIAVYRSLEEAGVTALMATHGGTFEFVLQKEGIPYEILEPRVSREESRRFVHRVIDPRGSLFDRDVLEAHVRSEMQFFEQRKVRAVLTGFTLSAALSARGAGIPLVVTHLGSFVPPVLERGMFAFAEYFDGSVAGILPRAWVDGAAGWIFRRARWQTSLFNAVADRLRIERVRSTVDVLMGDLTLVTDVPEILGIPEEEMEAWRPGDTRFLRPEARLKYAGAIFARLFGEVPEDVSDFLHTEKPKVFVSLSSAAGTELQPQTGRTARWRLLRVDEDPETR